MNRRTQFRIGSAIIVPIVLFGAIWKASAPIRIKRAVEQQASQQLQGVVDFSHFVCTEFRVDSAVYDAKRDAYRLDLRYDWRGKRGSSSGGSTCVLNKSATGYSGACHAVNGGKDLEITINP